MIHKITEGATRLGAFISLGALLAREKLSRNGSIHDYNNIFNPWYTAFTEIAMLNSGGGFARHTDWRLPNVNELQSIADYGADHPMVSAGLQHQLRAGLYRGDLQLHALGPSTGRRLLTFTPSTVRFMNFGGNGNVLNSFKTDPSGSNPYSVRAVRGD